MSDTTNTELKNPSIYAQVETLKEAVVETAEMYGNVHYGTLSISEVLTGLSALCDVLLTGGDMEAFLVSHRLRQPRATVADQD